VAVVFWLLIVGCCLLSVVVVVVLWWTGGWLVGWVGRLVGGGDAVAVNIAYNSDASRLTKSQTYIVMSTNIVNVPFRCVLSSFVLLVGDPICLKLGIN